MRATGPTVRRRNHAWLQMRSRERRTAQLVQRQQQQDDTSDDGDVSDSESVSSLDSLDSLDSVDSLASSDDGSNPQPTPTLSPVVASAKVRVPLASVSARVRTGRWIRTLPTPRAEVAAGVTLGVDAAVEPEVESESEPDGVESETDGIETDGEESANEDSADESTAPPAITTPPPAGVSPPPPAITSEASTSTIRPPPPPGADNTYSAAPPSSSSVTSTTSPSDTSTSSPSDTSTTSTYGTSETETSSSLSTMAPSSVTSKTKSSSSITSTKTPQEPRLGTMVPTFVPSASSSSSLDELVTSLTKTWPQTSMEPETSTASATNSAAPSVPVTGAMQSEDAQVISPDRQAEENGLSVGSAPSNTLNSGAVAGIVLGVLAFIGLLAGAALLWRKRRRDRGLPFFPQTRLRLRDDDNGNEKAHPPSVTGPLPGTIGGHNAAKTNTQIMDDLMKAAYATENGTNDMEGGAYAPAPAVPKLPPQLPPPQHQHQLQQEEVSVFMDEKAYVALAGPLTPASPERKPVMRWLDGVKTPTQPNGPEIPPTPVMPQSATMPSGGGRVLEQPRPAYYGRDTMTTDTTNTSVRWFG